MAYRHHYETTIRFLAMATRRGMGYMLLAGICGFSLLDVTSVEARQRAQAYASECNVTMPCDFSYNASRRRAERPARHVRVIEHRQRQTIERRHYSAPQYARRMTTSRQMVEHRRQTPDQRQLGAQQSAQTSEAAYTLTKPTRYIAGRLICAVNVGAALAERGIRGTGSALALSYLKWGRSAGGPVPGAVIVSSRKGGGHVAIVSRVSNGVVYAWNATGGQSGWREIPYRHRVLDYRVPG